MDQQRHAINQHLSVIDRAIATTRTVGAEFGISQTLLSGRLEFNDEYSKTLIAGSDKLVLADLNEEGANTLALQVRYQLGMQALTFLSQSQQSILKMFR